MEEKKNNKKKILIYSILGVVTLLIVTLTITYAYWILTRQQTGENVVNTACLNISFTGENDITLDKAYPMQPAELEKFLSTETPYHFTIHNECSELASATINLESLNAEGEKQLEDQYINVILYETDYHTNLNSEKKLIERIYNDENKVINNSLHAYSLYNFNLKPDETRDFNLLLYMDPQTPMVEANMNASWKGKITLSTGYKEDSKSIRKISSSDSQGMWGYKNKLTKIVIENTKSEKKALDGGKVYGPFDESEYGTKAVESYVVCEADDTNCVGYLQSNGKVVANTNSSYLFAYFSKITAIDGLENLNTSQVKDMSGMFGYLNNPTINFNLLDTRNVINMNGMFTDSKFINLNLSNFNTSQVEYMSGMFTRMSNLQEINLDNFDTKNVKNMSGMFSGVSSLSTLDLSMFETPNLTDMSGMFSGANFETLDLSGWDVTHVKNMSGMFNGMNNLQELNISDWDLSNYPYPLTAFGGNSSLETINMTNFVFPKDCSNLFSANNGLSALKNIILTNSDTSHVTNMTQMFTSNKNLTNLDLSSWDTSNVTNMMAMFSGTNFETLDLSTLNVSRVTSFMGMFDNMNNLTELNLSNWNMSSCLGMPNLFSKDPLLKTINMTSLVFPQNCTYFFAAISNSLNEIILDNADTSHVTNMSTMFASLTKLTSLNLSSFDTSNVTDMSTMFASLTLQSLDISSFNTSSVINFDQMFVGTTNLQSITFGPNFIHNGNATTSKMFLNCLAPERPTDDSWTDVSFD